MNSIQVVSPSYHGSTEESNQGRMVKLTWKMNELAKKVSRVAFIVFFAMHCLINIIYNLGTICSLTSGILATMIFITTNIYSIVNSVFDDMTRQTKERGIKLIVNKIEDEKRAQRLREAATQAEEAAREAEKAAQERARLAEEAAREAENAAQERARLAEEAANKRIIEAQAEAKQIVETANAKKEKKLQKLKARLMAECESLQQQCNGALTNNQGLEEQNKSLSAALEASQKAYNKANSELLQAHDDHRQDRENLIATKEKEKQEIQDAYELAVANTGKQRDEYFWELQEKKEELRKAEIKIAELGQKKVIVLTKALKALFKKCLTGDAKDELFNVIRLAKVANKKDISESARRAHQKYIVIFGTVLQKLTEQGVDLDLGTELTSVLKKAIERPDPSKPGVIDYLFHPIDSFRSASHSSSQPEPSQSSSSSSTSNPSQSDRSGSSGQVSTEASSSTTPSNPDSSMSPFIDGILEDGTKINFQRITGDDYGGFVTPKITQRDVSETLVALSKDEKTRGRLCDEVYEAMITNATDIIANNSGYPSLRTWKERQDLLVKSLIEIRKKYEGLLTFSAELDGDAVYQKSIDWLRTNRKSKDDIIKLMEALRDRKQAINNLKLNCINREVYYHLYCSKYLNKLGCESAMIYAEQKKKFPLYIWEQLPNSPHLSVRKSYSDPSLDQSEAVHLLYSMGRNHFDHLIVLDQPALAVDEVDSPSPPSSSSSSTTGEDQKTPPEETMAGLAESQAGNAEINSRAGGTLTDESVVSTSGSAEVTQNQPDDTQTKPAVEPATELPHSTAVATLNNPSDNESSDDDDSKEGDRTPESTSLLSSSSSNDGESLQIKPKKRGIFGSLFG